MAFDIRERIADLPVAQGIKVPFTFALKLAAEVRELRAAVEPDEDLIAAKEKDLEAQTYYAEIMSVPRGRREEIYQESLDLYPAKPSFTGGVDEKTQFLRGNFVRVSIVSAAVIRLIDPSGDVQEENIFEAIKTIHDDAPDQIFEILERRVGEINKEQDEQEELAKSTDF